MRKIKFRAWDSINNKLCSVIDFHCMNYPEQYTVMQFTGLLDKNGKEIYEEDIVEWQQLNTWHKGKVEYIGSGFYVMSSGYKDDLNEPVTVNLISALNCSVIGNSYEDSELIK